LQLRENLGELIMGNLKTSKLHTLVIGSNLVCGCWVSYYSCTVINRKVIKLSETWKSKKWESLFRFSLKRVPFWLECNSETTFYATVNCEVCISVCTKPCSLYGNSDGYRTLTELCTNGRLKLSKYAYRACEYSAYVFHCLYLWSGFTLFVL
jgi:hypothetical protein